jgi:hypothetical protein
MKLNCGAERHHYSMFNVERSMFIFSKSMTRCIFAFKYEAEKKWGGVRGISANLVHVFINTIT